MSVRAPSSTVPAAAPPVTASPDASDTGGDSNGAMALLAVPVLAAGGVGAWVVLRRRRDHEDAAPAPAVPRSHCRAAPPSPPSPPPAEDPAPAKVWGVVPPPPPLDVPESPPHLPADVSATIVAPAPPPEPAPEREPRRAGSRPARRQRVPEAVTVPAAVDVADDADWLEVGPLRLSPTRREAWSGASQLQLTAAELNVLEVLMRSQGAGVTADAITVAAHAADDVAEDERVDPDQLLAQLRRKLSVRGRGPAVRKERVVMYFFGER